MTTAYPGIAMLRRPGAPWRLPVLVTGVALAMTACPRGRHGPPFGPWRWFGQFGGTGGFPRGQRAGRGDVREAALLLLAEGPLNGYQIMQEIERRSNGVWRPSAGSVYPALAQLEDQGLVRSEERRDRRSYTLTDAGRARADARRGASGAPWEQMSGADDEDVSALFLETRRLGMAAGQIGHLGSAEQVARARQIVANAHRAIYGLLAEDDSETTPGSRGRP